MRLFTRVGSNGGRELGNCQSNKQAAAVAHVLPWHAPIPQRVCNFASIQLLRSATLSKVTSSHRQKIVSGRASVFNSARNLKLFSRRCANKRYRCL